MSVPYQFSGDGVILTVDEVPMYVSPDPGNAQWQAFQAWREAGNEPNPEVVSAPAVPATISDRQFFQQLATAGAITKAEALAAVKTGDIPAALQAFIDALPSDQRFNAEMLVSGATIFERAHPVTAQLGLGMGWTAEQLDDFWRAAAAL